MQTVGYCGADLKSLCAESALVALRSKYPQIYSSRQKLLIDVNSLVVSVAAAPRLINWKFFVCGVVTIYIFLFFIDSNW